MSDKAVTDKAAYWVIPSAVSKVHPKPLREIKLSVQPKMTADLKHQKFVDIPSAEESGKMPAILALIEPYAADYVPHSLGEHMLKTLGEIFSKDNLSLNLEQHVEMGEQSMYLYDVSRKQQKYVFRETLQQAKTKLWFNIRAGRVTASKLEAVFSTKPEKPALSLIMGICYPELSKFKNAATEWGCKHEALALASCETLQKQHHEQVKISKSGLFISVKHCFLEATPGGLTSCSCCGEGLVEVKVWKYLEH